MDKRGTADGSRATQYKPGQSGNKAGRPRRAAPTSESLVDILQRLMRQKVVFEGPNGPRKVTFGEVFAQKALRLALDGEVLLIRHIFLLMERAKNAEAADPLHGMDPQAAKTLKMHSAVAKARNGML